MKTLKIKYILVILFMTILSCSQDKTSGTTEFKVDFEKFTLDNGLQVVFHIDRSDPVVAVLL